MIETTAIPRRSPLSASRIIDGQAVIAVSGVSLVHILNDVGTRVWSLIDGTRTVQEIVAEVRNQLVKEDYDSLPSDLEKDVDEFLEDVKSKGMITMGDA